MLFLIMGASGSGKSSCLPFLRQLRPEVDWRDFDDAPVRPQNTAERQLVTEDWLTVAIHNQARGVSTGIAGTVVLGEVLACPSAPLVKGLRALLLDCADVQRIDRIRARDGAHATAASQDMLSWAAWLRMHAVDPQWRQDVIKAQGIPEMTWSRWDTWERGDSRWSVPVFDNTALDVDETAEGLARWVSEHLPKALKPCS